MNNIHNKAYNAATYPWVSHPKIASQAYEHMIICLLQSDIANHNEYKKHNKQFKLS